MSKYIRTGLIVEFRTEPAWSPPAFTNTVQEAFWQRTECIILHRIHPYLLTIINNGFNKSWRLRTVGGNLLHSQQTWIIKIRDRSFVKALLQHLPGTGGAHHNVIKENCCETPCRHPPGTAPLCQNGPRLEWLTVAVFAIHALNRSTAPESIISLCRKLV